MVPWLKACEFDSGRFDKSTIRGGHADAVPWPPLAQALARLEVPQPNPLLDQGKEALAGLANLFRYLARAPA